MSDPKRGPRPEDYDDLFPGRFLKAADLKGRPYTLQITGVEIEILPGDDGGEDPCGVLSFARTEKRLVVNSTNGQCIKAMFGRQVQAWVGHRITFCPETTKMGRPGGGTETVPCIRVQGSPELSEPMTVTIKLPRRKDTTRRLVPTGRRSGGAPDTPHPSEEPGGPPDEGPDYDRQPGEDDE